MAWAELGNMTIDEKREYKRTMEQKRRQSLTGVDKEIYRENDRKRKSDERIKKRVENEAAFKQEIAEEKAAVREKKKRVDENAFKLGRAKEKV